MANAIKCDLCGRLEEGNGYFLKRGEIPKGMTLFPELIICTLCSEEIEKVTEYLKKVKR